MLNNSLSNAITEVLAPFDIDETAMLNFYEAIEKILSDGYVRKELYKEKLAELDALKESLESASLELSTAVNSEMKFKEMYEEAISSFEQYKENQRISEEKIKKEAAVTQNLLSDGANPDFIRVLLKEIDLDSVILDVEDKEDSNDATQCIQNWEEIAAPLKKAFPELFGKIVELFSRVATPPVNGPIYNNPWQKDTLSLEEQIKLYRTNPALARQLAASVGIKL